MTPDTSGPTLPAPSAYYDPEACCWRTSGVMFPSDWPTSSATCPAWGMTLDGELYALPTPELRMVEPVSSSLLPTPVVNDMGAGKAPEAWDEWTARMQSKHGNGNGHGASLAIEAQRLLPTPVADHSRGLPQPGTDYASLPNAVLALLPTPVARDHKGDGQVGTASHAEALRRGQLEAVTTALLPTPGCAGGGKKIPEDATWSGKAAYKTDGKKVQVHID